MFYITGGARFLPINSSIFLYFPYLSRDMSVRVHPLRLEELSFIPCLGKIKVRGIFAVARLDWTKKRKLKKAGWEAQLWPDIVQSLVEVS